jgi:hypothetical protein
MEENWYFNNTDFLKFNFIIVLGKIHCGIYKGSYNVSNNIMLEFILSTTLL